MAYRIHPSTAQLLDEDKVERDCTWRINRSDRGCQSSIHHLSNPEVKPRARPTLPPAPKVPLSAAASSEAKASSGEHEPAAVAGAAFATFFSVFVVVGVTYYLRSKRQVRLLGL